MPGFAAVVFESEAAVGRVALERFAEDLSRIAACLGELTLELVASEQEPIETFHLARVAVSSARTER